MFAEGDDEDEEIDLRVKRQREALVRVKEEVSSLKQQPPSTEVASTTTSNKRHHLTVKSARAKCSKSYVHQSSSQQRHRQLQFLRYVHSAQKKLNENNKNYINEE